MSKSFIIGSRGSELALWQANFVKDELASHFPDRVFEIKIIKTTGDEIVDISLSKIGDKGLFTKQIETALLNGEIDAAVHSLKDLQTTQPDGLTIGAVCKRELPGDALVSTNFASIDDLPRNGTVATGSLRRRSQLLNYRPDLKVVDIRGNVPTRLRKFDESSIDAMILAYAGLHRLGFDERITQLIPHGIILPAVGQGAVAVEVRSDDTQVLHDVAKLNDHFTRICITAERAFLRHLEGGCQVPIGALAVLDKDVLRLDGIIASLDGETVLRKSIEGRSDDSEKMGIDLADRLINMGAGDLLDRVRAAAEAVIR